MTVSPGSKGKYQERGVLKVKSTSCAQAMQGGPKAWGEQLDPVGKLNCKHIVEGPEGHSNQFVIGA